MGIRMGFYSFKGLLFYFIFTFKTVLTSPIATNHFSMNINMPDVKPNSNDDYICTAKKLNPIESYIIQYEPDADGRTAHHMLLFGCQGLKSQAHLYPKYWNCGGDLCSQMTIMYGWAKNAPSMKLPPNVGFLVGGNSTIQYIVLQVHYAKALGDGVTDNTGLKLHMTTERQPFITGIHLLMADVGQIPPNQPKYPIDLNCKYKSNVPIHVFAFRVHTHKLGSVVTGYKFNVINESWMQLAKGNPNWPQAFYPITHPITVTNNDVLAARCTYNSSGMSTTVSIGAHTKDEMCNLYLMYYTDYRNRYFNPILPCVGLEYSNLIDILPVGNDVPLPPNEALEHEAHASRFHSTAITYSDIEDDAHDRDALSLDQNQFVPEFKYQEVHAWPSKKLKFGQISGIAVDHKGNTVILHRGSHTWDSLTFDYFNNYHLSRDHPIPESTVVTIDPISGAILHQWGANFFFIPHGLTIDFKGRYWITDVALHQVFCFDESTTKINLVFGEKFVPGNDESHFCKPTSTAIAKNGEIYIADGYCNARIMKFSANGKFLSQFGKASNAFEKHPPVRTFNIPHKVILLEDKNLLCVADRENGRIQCFTMDGNFRFKIERKEFGDTIYSIAHANDLLFAVSGEAIYQDRPVKAFAFNITDHRLASVFTPESGTFKRPHDIAVSEDGEEVYVCEIGPNVVWKFIQEFHKSTKKVLVSSDVELVPMQHVQEHVVNDKIEEKNEDETSNFETSMIIMALLSIPVLFIILITVSIRLRKRGRLQSCSFGHIKGWLGGYRTPHPQEKFNLGTFLHPHKGFDKVALEESDGEDEGSASDTEELNMSNKA